jgi:phospholipid/cholesterol/gamma-HCH transport system permease protein
MASPPDSLTLDTRRTPGAPTAGRAEPPALLRTLLESVGGIAVLTRDVCTRGLRRLEWRLLLEQLEHLGWRSLTIVALIALFTGMVMALQMGIFLGKFGAKIYISGVIGLAVVRELGPTLCALMVGARAGAGIAAEIGSMAVSEQLDALRALGADPVRKLVVPRLLALLIIVPALTVIANALGILGGYIVSVLELRVDSTFYFSSLFRGGWLVFSDVFSGLGKSIFFGYFIGIIACYNGLHVTGGADGVGRATTRTVVACSVTVLISDFFLTKLFILLPTYQQLSRLLRTAS